MPVPVLPYLLGTYLYPNLHLLDLCPLYLFSLIPLPVADAALPAVPVAALPADFKPLPAASAALLPTDCKPLPALSASKDAFLPMDLPTELPTFPAALPIPLAIFLAPSAKSPISTPGPPTFTDSYLINSILIPNPCTTRRCDCRDRCIISCDTPLSCLLKSPVISFNLLTLPLPIGSIIVFLRVFLNLVLLTRKPRVHQHKQF